MKHRGEIVEKLVRNRISISEFSRRLNVSRRTIYNWFAKDDLSLKIIKEISVALGYDFSSEFPELLAGSLSDRSIRHRHANTYSKDHASDHAMFWKDKYTNLLEVHEAMLRDHGMYRTQFGGAR